MTALLKELLVKIFLMIFFINFIHASTDTLVEREANWLISKCSENAQNIERGIDNPLLCKEIKDKIQSIYLQGHEIDLFINLLKKLYSETQGSDKYTHICNVIKKITKSFHNRDEDDFFFKVAEKINLLISDEEKIALYTKIYSDFLFHLASGDILVQYIDLHSFIRSLYKLTISETLKKEIIIESDEMSANIFSFNDFFTVSPEKKLLINNKYGQALFDISDLLVNSIPLIYVAQTVEALIKNAVRQDFDTLDDRTLRNLAGILTYCIRHQHEISEDMKTEIENFFLKLSDTDCIAICQKTIEKCLRPSENKAHIELLRYIFNLKKFSALELVKGYHKEGASKSIILLIQSGLLDDESLSYLAQTHA
jgi:hypothetical protein